VTKVVTTSSAAVHIGFIPISYLVLASGGFAGVIGRIARATLAVRIGVTCYANATIITDAQCSLSGRKTVNLKSRIDGQGKLVVSKRTIRRVVNSYSVSTTLHIQLQSEADTLYGVSHTKRHIRVTRTLVPVCLDGNVRGVDYARSSTSVCSLKFERHGVVNTIAERETVAARVAVAIVVDATAVRAY
jgi:hypothetical protein